MTNPFISNDGTQRYNDIEMTVEAAIEYLYKQLH